MLAPMRPDDATYELQAKEGPAACRGLPTCTDCPIGSADVGRTGHGAP